MSAAIGTGREWSKAELEHLRRRLAEGAALPDIADECGRSPRACYDRARELGLLRPVARAPIAGGVQARKGRDEQAAALFLRNCLRCRVVFAPSHRHNFLCRDCNEFAASAVPL